MAAHAVSGGMVAPGPNSFIYRITITAAIAGFLFGFDTAIINGALIFLRQEFNLSELGIELAAGSLLAGSLFGASGAGVLSDRFGRKRILLAAGALFSVSSIGTALPRNLTEFIAARFIAGLAIGVASVLSPMYIAEIAPPRVRGRLVALNQLAIVGGVLSAFSVNWGLASLGQASWRYMFAVAAIPSLAFFFALLSIPESPRWLLKAGFDEYALRVLRKITGPMADAEASQIRASLAEESGTARELLAPHLRRPLLIASCLAVLSQITGINTVNYYGSILFRDHAGNGSDSSAIGTSVIIGAMNLVCTVIALGIIDRVGRRKMLLFGSLGLTVSLTMLGFGLSMSPPPTLFILIAVLLFIGVFALSFGPVIWVYISELFPTAVRGRAMSVATLMLWAACLLVSVTFLSLMKYLSPPVTFWLYASMSVVAFLFVWKWVPETKNRSLEEIQRFWQRKDPLPEPETAAVSFEPSE